MNRLRPFTALIAAPVLLLSSCIDSREEIWLNPSGSGKARITVSLPSSVITLRGGPDAVSDLIDTLLVHHPSITSAKKKITATAQNRIIIDVSLHFDSAIQLSSTMEKAANDPKLPAPIRHFLGITSLERNGTTFTGKRVINIGKAIPGSRFFPASKADHHLQTILHLPFAPSDHNATRVQNNGRTLIWDTPLSTAIRTSQTQRIEIRPPTALLIAVPATIILVPIAVFLLWRRWAKSRRRHVELPP